MKIKDRANVYLALALLLGALVPVMLDIGTNMNTTEFLFIAYLIATVASLGFVLATKRGSRLVEYLSNARYLAMIGVIGILNYALFEYGMAFAEHYISASLATAVYRTYPILMLLFLPAILREHVTKYQVAALGLGLLGLLIALTGGSIGTLADSNAGIIAFMAFIALGSAVAAVLVKRYSFDIVNGVFIFSVANLLFFSVIYAASGFPQSTVTTGDIAALIYVGVVYNVFVGIMYYSALRMLKTTFVTNIYFLSPFITFFFSYLLLGEAIAPYYVVIAVLVSAGILIQKLDRKGGTYVAKKHRASKTVIFDVTSAFVNSGYDAVLAPIMGGGRVLAVTVDGSSRQHVDAFIRTNADAYNAVLYTDSHKSVTPNEAEFVREMMGARRDQLVFMCAGKPDSGELAVDHLIRSLGAVGDGTAGEDLPDGGVA